MKMMRSLAFAGMFLMFTAVDAQDRGKEAQPPARGAGVQPVQSSDRAAAAAAGRERKVGPEGEASAKSLAEAYTRALYLNEKEYNRVKDAFLESEKDLIAARAKLAMAQQEIDALLKKHITTVDATFTEEQRNKLRKVRGAGEWDEYLDPCGCKAGHKGEAKPGISARPSATGAGGATPQRQVPSDKLEQMPNRR